jgi:FkbM family methyltransferase
MKNKNIIRSVMRRIIPTKGYRFSSHLLNIFEVARKYGLKTLLELYYPKNNNSNFATVHFCDFNHPFFFRPGTTDADTIIQNIIREEYGHLPKGIEPNWIIDAGGYIGDVAVYFGNRFKSSRILSLEPDLDNFRVAVRNIKPYSNQITLLQKGLWSHTTVLELGGSLSGAKIEKVSKGEEKQKIKVTDINSLMREYSIDYLDILKMDIEGAEKEILLAGSDAWLTKTKALIVEFHDSEIRKTCCNLLNSYGFRGFRYRSLHYFFL